MIRSIAFVGSCQVRGMGAAAQQLRPDLEIEAHHIGIEMNDRQLAERIAGFDLVISQIGENDPQHPALAPTLVRPTVGNLVTIPIFVFPGLHPDMIYIFHNGRPFPGPYSDMHSLLAVSCYLLGLSEQRTLNLFNTYVFAELGYFSGYDTSCDMMTKQFEAAGFDMHGRPEQWMREHGSFMYTVNHPAGFVLSHMANEALKRAELVPQDSPPPVGVEDHLHHSFVAPLLPPLAQRLGIPGGTEYLKPLAQYGSKRGLDLKEYIEASFKLYQETDRDLLQSDQICHACDRLKSILC